MRDGTVRGKRIDNTEFALEIDDWAGLQEFSIQGQQLSEIDLFNLMYGLNLENINLSENHLSELNLIFLQSCRRLVSLDISKNILKRVDLCSLKSEQAGTHYLRSINLANNSLIKLDLSHLEKCYNLKFLDLRYNNFIKLDLSPLRHCKQLEELLIDEELEIEWRNTIYEIETISEGLKKYSKKIECAWKEYLKEVDIFRKKEPLVENRLIRAMWLEELEQKKEFEWTKLYSFSLPIYAEVRNSYIYGCYRGTISTVFSLMESFLTKELPFEDLLKEKKLLKKTSKCEKNPKIEVDPKRLNLSVLVKIAKKKGYISTELYNQFYMYLPVRHGIIHYPESTTPLGFYRKSIRGRGSKSRGVSFESPNRKEILPLKHQDAAEKGITLFLDLLKEFRT